MDGDRGAHGGTNVSLPPQVANYFKHNGKTTSPAHTDRNLKRAKRKRNGVSDYDHAGASLLHAAVSKRTLLKQRPSFHKKDELQS